MASFPTPLSKDEIVHFIGIGGTGMSSLALAMHDLGYKVQGTDVSTNEHLERLARKGIPISLESELIGLGKATVVVVSTAIPEDHKEVVAAKQLGIPVVHRAGALSAIMQGKRVIGVTGTHGKTTTTAMIDAVLRAGLLEPTVINGGVMNAHRTNSVVSSGDWMIAELDESDGSFMKYSLEILIVTNINPEHLRYWGSFEALNNGFRERIDMMSPDGLIVACIDNPVVRSIIEGTKSRIITYGRDPQADVRISRVEPDGLRLRFVLESKNTDQRTEKFEIPVPGEHMAYNATAASIVAHQLGVERSTIASALSGYSGVQCRFTILGQWNGVTIVDDYAHHPVEIAATLKAAREAFRGHVVVVIRPVRYTRLQDLLDDFCTCFVDADTVFVGPVFARGETEVKGVRHDALVDGIRRSGHQDVRIINGPEDLAGILITVSEPGGCILSLRATPWVLAALPGLQPSR